MKKLIIPMLAGAMSLAAFQAMAADKVTLQLKWVTQAQFAGYYVAKAKGFYEAEGLDVDIKPGGPDIAPEQVIAGGGADVIVDWMGGALAAREKGVPLVNIAQPFKKAGMELVCPKDGPIKTEADFKGHTLGVWFFGNEYPFFAWMNKLGLSTEGGAIDEGDLFAVLAVLALPLAIDRKAEFTDGHLGRCVFQLWITGQVAHKEDFVVAGHEDLLSVDRGH